MNYIKYIYGSLLILTYIIIFPVVAVEEGSLTVITDPEGVEVWLGDKYLGDSPIEERKLRAGRYTIKLIDPIQQVSATEEVFIQSGLTTTIEKSLKKKFGTLKVTSDPEGAEVFISTSLGKTPVENNFMNPGKYHIEIKHPKKNYESIADEVVIPQGKTVELTNTLVKKSAFDTKALVRLVLGAGAIGGFIWGLIEQGNLKQFETEAVFYGDMQPEKKKKAEEDADKAAIKRTLGIIIGATCVVGFEIVAFF